MESWKHWIRVLLREFREQKPSLHPQGPVCKTNDLFCNMRRPQGAQTLQHPFKYMRVRGSRSGLDLSRTSIVSANVQSRMEWSTRNSCDQPFTIPEQRNRRTLSKSQHLSRTVPCQGRGVQPISAELCKICTRISGSRPGHHRHLLRHWSVSKVSFRTYEGGSRIS